jgi:hypothetical protein
MLINLNNLTPEQARWVAEHERLHREALALFNKHKQKRKQLNTLMDYIINEQIREANDGS